MDFDHTNAKSQDLLHIRQDVRGVPRVQASAGNQALRIFLGVVGDKLIYACGKPNHFRRDIVNEHRPVDTGPIKIFQESFRGAAELGDFLEIGSLLFHQLQRLRLEHLHGLDMNVAVGDQVRGLSLDVGRWPENLNHYQPLRALAS